MKKDCLVKRGSLSVQISLYFLAALMLLLSFYGISTYRNGSAIIIEKTKKDTLESIEHSSDYIANYIENLKRVSKVLADNNQVKQYVQKNLLEDREYVSNMIDMIQETDESFVSLLIISRDGHLVSNEQDTELSTSSNMMQEDWYMLAIEKKGQPVLTSARRQSLSSNQDNWVISVTQEIMSDSDENLGVVRLDIDYKRLNHYLSQLNFGENGTIFIINDRNQLVYNQDLTVFTNQNFQAKIQAVSKKKEGFNKKNNELIYHKMISGTDWQLIGVASLEELSMISNSMLRMLILSSALMLLVVLLGSILIAHKLTKPLRVLENSMRNVVSGLSEAKVKEKGTDEVRHLAKSFNLMLDQMERLITEGTERDKIIHKYQLNTLTSQINPHFLYNTLDTIIWMAEFNDNDLVIETTKSLSNFFRLSLNQGNEIITLKNEIDQVRQYLFIQKQRYGDQLNYEFSEDTNLYDYQIPKLIVQPIVENAIYHGIKEINRPGFIKIKTYEDEINFYIEIYDNGKGFDINKEIVSHSTKLGGIGISNVDERLKLQYGDGYQMMIDSNLKSFTCITLKISQQYKSTEISE